MRSRVESANTPGTDFPLENLPFGVIEKEVIGVAIGDQILNLKAAAKAGLLGEAGEAASAGSLNALMRLSAADRLALRRRLTELLQDDQPDQKDLVPFLIPMREAVMQKPVQIGDYTDFYASIHHAANVGRRFRPDNPLLPNYKYVPIGYHGRASSIVIGGTKIKRPQGQIKPATADAPTFSPTRSLDYEVEAGFYIAVGNPLGEPIQIDEAESRIFGLCLVNDWSARDIQAWEYQPLGPFLAKSFATSISPWVVTMEALAPFRAPAFKRPPGDPQPLPHLRSAADQAKGAIDLTLELYLASSEMRDRNIAPLLVSRSNLSELYWTPAQLLTHHASNGCNLQPGDLLASGTVSGENPSARGCLLERTEPLELPTGETRKFLEDGDEVILRGFCERAGHTRIGFGECRGVVVP